VILTVLYSRDSVFGELNVCAMGVTTEQWRATVGRWSGGRPGKRVIIEDLVARKPDCNSYRWFRLFVLASLLVIGCVELNPGPNSVKVRLTYLFIIPFFYGHVYIQKSLQWTREIRII
jgi:hypothetical protein